MRRIVVLPEPDGPISASFSPGITCIDSPSSTLKGPKLLLIPSMRMMGAGMHVSRLEDVHPNDARVYKIMSIAKIIS